MEEFKKRFIHIHHCRGVRWKTLYQFLKNDDTLLSVYRMTESDLVKNFGMKLNQAKVFLSDLHTISQNDILCLLNEQRILPLTLFDDQYPTLLKYIYDPPWILYCKGNPSLLNNPLSLSIVGSRNPSSYSSLCLERILPPLIKKDFTIVSGLALGVDTLAHILTISENGKTIGVLGSGFLHIYPHKNKSLAEAMIKEHLIITEYPPHSRAQKWHFPERNRIISGLTRGVLVVEAQEKSGSLITADQSLEQGREVFAIPGSIFNENSTGTHRLIQSGAKLVTSAKDILDEWNL